MEKTEQRDVAPQTTWPPAPVTPDPQAEHEAVLTALLRAPATKQPLSRLRLMRGLREETGLDLRQCLAVANAFCDRHGVFPQRRGLRLWLTLLPPLAQVALTLTMLAGQIVVGRELNAAPTLLARHILFRERIERDVVLLFLILLTLIANVFTTLAGIRRVRREDAAAREKAATWR